MSDTLVLSLRPHWTRLILDGKKTVEIRGSAPRRRVSTALLYETMPRKLVVGKASIVEVSTRTPDAIWREFGDRTGMDHDTFDTYVNGRRQITAIALSNAERLIEPRTLRELGIMRAPQSWMYLRGKE